VIAFSLSDLFFSTGLVGYKIYEYVNLEEQKKNAKGRTKSLKKSKRERDFIVRRECIEIKRKY
jgi:hypothetical protein